MPLKRYRVIPLRSEAWPGQQSQLPALVGAAKERVRLISSSPATKKTSILERAWVVPPNDVTSHKRVWGVQDNFIRRSNALDNFNRGPEVTTDFDVAKLDLSVRLNDANLQSLGRNNNVLSAI